MCCVLCAVCCVCMREQERERERESGCPCGPTYLNLDLAPPLTSFRSFCAARALSASFSSNSRRTALHDPTRRDGSMARRSTAQHSSMELSRAGVRDQEG